jgi:uncharacterized protein (TIGR02246 family)
VKILIVLGTRERDADHPKLWRWPDRRNDVDAELAKGVEQQPQQVPWPRRLSITTRLISCLAATTAAASLIACTHDASTLNVERDKAAIEAALRQWPVDFNAENGAGVCGLFAEDAVLAYPGGEDRDRSEFCARMQKLFDDPAKRFSYAQPDIREVLVDGDLATVKLFWTLTVSDKSGKVLDTSVEDGLDVFRRQRDGAWKIHLSHAFTK